MIYHTPVLVSQTLSFLSGLDSLCNLIDCNLGEGGHSGLFLKEFPSLHVKGIDCDSVIQQVAKERLVEFGERIEFINEWADDFLSQCEDESADCIFFDLGLSMFHYKSSGRGFSFARNERLDMRLNSASSLTAWDIVNHYDEKKLADVLFLYGEERKARKITARIVEKRRTKAIDTTFELKDVIDSCYSSEEKRRMHIEPSTKTFQALRIEVNGELDRLKRGLSSALRVLNKGGLLMVISFHSLEDRIVKWTLREKAKDEIEILTRHPIVPDESEIETNPASRSSKLRVARRI